MPSPPTSKPAGIDTATTRKPARPMTSSAGNACHRALCHAVLSPRQSQPGKATLRLLRGPARNAINAAENAKVGNPASKATGTIIHNGGNSAASTAQIANRDSNGKANGNCR